MRGQFCLFKAAGERRLGLRLRISQAPLFRAKLPSPEPADCCQMLLCAIAARKERPRPLLHTPISNIPCCRLSCATGQRKHEWTPRVSLSREHPSRIDIMWPGAITQLARVLAMMVLFPCLKHLLVRRSQALLGLFTFIYSVRHPTRLEFFSCIRSCCPTSQATPAAGLARHH